MARLRERKRSDGGTTFQVRWRAGGGNGPEQSESFTNLARARAFLVAVEDAGNRWLTDDQGRLWMKGRGYVAANAVEPEISPTFEAVAQRWLQHQRSVRVVGVWWRGPQWIATSPSRPPRSPTSLRGP